MGQPHATSRCSANCLPHNQTLDLLEKRLAEVEAQVYSYLERNTHIATVLNEEQEEAPGVVVDFSAVELTAYH